MSAFTIRADGGTYTADRSEIRRALSLLIAPGDQHELRGLPSGRGLIATGDDLDASVESACSLSDGQVYYSLNPIRPGTDRANKRNVTARRWFLVDIDPKRPIDVSSTEGEKAASCELACHVTDHLLEQGWPGPLMIDSGNGWHLLYRIDLPNDQLSQQVLKSCLKYLADKFDTDSACVDKATHDAPRISKLPGTMARKGTPTADRPHRMARIAYEPESIVVVTIDQLQALVNADLGTNGMTGHLPSFTTRATETSKDAYVRSAIERECFRVALAPSGERNDLLNKAAFALGTMANWPEMHEVDAKTTLQRSAERAGLLDREILLTIASGWAAGKASPRPRPADPMVNGTPNRNPPLSEMMLVTFGLETDRKLVEWIWQDRIAKGFISIFAGKTGIGKSFVLLDIIARLTTGRPLPGQSFPCPITRVMVISEDPKDYVLIPRLMELGADLRLIAFMTWEAMAAYTIDNIDMLERAYGQAKEPGLIVIDPPANFLGKKDQHKDAEVRSLVMRLVAWLDTKRVASVFVTHVNKQINKMVEALDRIMGSVAWGSTSRIAIGFAPDPNTPTQCLCVGIKNNIGQKASSLIYEIVKTDSLAKVEWKGDSDVSADEALSQTKRKSRGECCVEWLTGKFREKPEWESDELKKEAHQAGFSKNALWSPEVNALPLKKKRRSNAAGEDYWVWRAEPGWPAPEKNNGKDGNLGNVETQPF
jgi:hypothetical protein